MSRRWLITFQPVASSFLDPLLLFYHVPVLPNRRLVGDWPPLSCATLPRNGHWHAFESPYPRCLAISLVRCVVFAALLSRRIGWTRCPIRGRSSEAPVLPNCGLPNGLGIPGIGPGRWPPPPEWAQAHWTFCRGFAPTRSRGLAGRTSANVAGSVKRTSRA